MKQRAEFLKEASNVYRTPHYIVRQRLGLLYNDEEANQLISRDTYYERTPERDAEYEIRFKKRIKIDGKRIRSNVTVRGYKP